MRITDGFACNRAQAKTLVGVEAATLQAAVVEGERFRLAVLDEQFTVIGAGERLRQNLAHGGLVAVEQFDEIGVHAQAPG